MKRMKTTVLVVILMALATFSIGIAAEAVLIKSEQKNIESDIGQQSLFDAEITFYVHEGEGCGCKPIVGASISATGGEGSDSGVTDEEGKCVLHLVIMGEYRVHIDADGFQIVLFDFNVIDDQIFGFHMQEKKKSFLNEVPLFYHFVRNIFDR